MIIYQSTHESNNIELETSVTIDGDMVNVQQEEPFECNVVCLTATQAREVAAALIVAADKMEGGK